MDDHIEHEKYEHSGKGTLFFLDPSSNGDLFSFLSLISMLSTEKCCKDVDVVSPSEKKKHWLMENQNSK